MKIHRCTIHTQNKVSLKFEVCSGNGFRDTRDINFSGRTDGRTDGSTDGRTKANLYALHLKWLEHKKGTTVNYINTGNRALTKAKALNAVAIARLLRQI